jgi:hypothetical protein
MSTSQPPKLAIWILKHSGCSPNNEAVIGDLVERYKAGKSPTWFWKQIALAIVHGFYEEAFGNKVLVLQTILFGWCGYIILDSFLLQLVSNWVYWSMFVLADGKMAGYFPPLVLLTLYRSLPLMRRLLSIAIAGWIAARVGREHRNAALFSYAGTVTIAILFGLVAEWLDRPPYIVSWSWTSMLIVLLHIPAILLGSLFGTSTRSIAAKAENA